MNKGNVHSNSFIRLQQISQQQQQIAKVLAVTNFYQGSELKIEDLKIKLSEVKAQVNNGKNLKPINKQKRYPQSQINLQQDVQKQKINHKNHYINQKNTQLSNHNFNNKINRIKINSTLQHYDNQYEKLHHKKPYLIEKINKQAYKIKYKLEQKNKQNKKIDNKNNNNNNNTKNIYYNKQRIKSFQQSDDKNQQQLLSKSFIKKIILTTQIQLLQFENKITQLWSLYQLLSRIMQGIQKYHFQQELSILKYIQNVCSNKYQFILEFIYNCLNHRLQKIIFLTRLLQNLSIIYLCLQLCRSKRKIKQSYLINFIGYATSNLIFIIKLMSICYILPQQLPFHLDIQNIFENIKQFQKNAYKNQNMEFKQILLHIQHNNEIIHIIQQRLCQKSTKQFQLCINNFLKNVYRDHKPLFEYSHYIFEYITYYLHKQKLLGRISFLEIAPYPFLSLKLSSTIVIDPIGVLISHKVQNIFLRAHSQTLIENLIKKCNIVYWSDLMPEEVDNLFDLLPMSTHIPRLYKYHCKQDNGFMVKVLWRLGTLPENIIIIDRKQEHFKHDYDSGIIMPWKGQKRDRKLFLLLKLIQPLLNNGQTLRKNIKSIRKDLQLLKSKDNIAIRKIHFKQFTPINNHLQIQSDEMQFKLQNKKNKKNINKYPNNNKIHNNNKNNLQIYNNYNNNNNNNNFNNLKFNQNKYLISQSQQLQQQNYKWQDKNIQDQQQPITVQLNYKYQQSKQKQSQQQQQQQQQQKQQQQQFSKPYSYYTNQH